MNCPGCNEPLSARDGHSYHFAMPYQRVWCPSCDISAIATPGEDIRHLLRAQWEEKDRQARLDQAETADAALREIANIAHHGGLIGYDSEGKALNEIRRLSLPWWNRMLSAHPNTGVTQKSHNAEE